MKKYPKYKDSGVEWLGEIPSDWVVIPLKHFCDVRDGTHDTPKYVTPDINSLPLVTSKDLFNGILSLEYTNHISSNDYEIIKRSEVSYGDILMPMIGTVGGAVVVNTKASFAIKNIALFKYSSKYNNKWLFYLLNSEIVSIQFDLNKTGGVQNFVSLGSLRNLIIFYPPLPEQLSIVQFLDHKTNRIDRFIANRKKQIELLKEQKAGIINKAVTKGINPMLK
jgi:type I restriction enzyme, S subunit